MLTKYSDEIETDMRSLYESLSEKDRRRYAAIEAKKLMHGGIVYIATLFDCDEKTIRKGIKELANPESLEQSTIRRLGGGRKPIIPNTLLRNFFWKFYENILPVIRWTRKSNGLI